MASGQLEVDDAFQECGGASGAVRALDPWSPLQLIEPPAYDLDVVLRVAEGDIDLAPSFDMLLPSQLVAERLSWGGM